MARLLAAGLLGACLLAAQAAAQTVHVMTPANINAVLAAVQPGDTVRMEGLFTSQIFIRNRDFGGVRFDASAATVAGGMRLVNVHNVSFSGGEWRPIGSGEALRLENVSHVSFAEALVRGNGDRTGVGMRVIGGQFLTVRDNRFDNLRNGLLKGGVTDSLVTRNQWLNGGEDGMKLVNSQRVIVSHNLCAGYLPLPSYHPDCIQMWYTTNQPPQSDIYILNNVAIGQQQGFASFDPANFSGTRFTFAGNLVATTTPHSISCLGCTDSQFFDNILIALPDARWRTFLRAPGVEAGNLFSNNRVLDLRGQFDAVLPDPVFTSFTPSIAGLVGSRWDDRSFGLLLAPNPSAAPEPQGWMMLITGFGLVGLIRRRRSAREVALHQHDVEPAAELFPHLLQQAGPLEPAGGVQADRGFVG